MIISKTGTLRLLRILGVFCALTMGFLTLVGTSANDAADAVGVDRDVEADADLSLDPVTVEKSGSGGLSIMADGTDCNTITIKEALDAVKDDIENYDKLDIDSVELLTVSGSYTAQWEPSDKKTLECSLTITGLVEGAPSTTIATTAIQATTGSLSEILTDDNYKAINHYLEYRNQQFEYCVTCSDATEEITSYSVEYNVDIGVTIKGKVNL